MRRLQRTALLPYPPGDVYEVVSDVESYPEFLDWCKDATIVEASATEVTANLVISARNRIETLVTRNTLTILMQHSEIVLCKMDTLLSCFEVPVRCLLVISRHALSAFVHQSQVVLSISITLLCCPPVPIRRFKVVLLYSLTFRIHVPN